MFSEGTTASAQENPHETIKVHSRVRCVSFCVQYTAFNMIPKFAVSFSGRRRLARSEAFARVGRQSRRARLRQSHGAPPRGW